MKNPSKRRKYLRNKLVTIHPTDDILNHPGSDAIVKPPSRMPRPTKAGLEFIIPERTAALQLEIAERERVEEILRESEERFSKAFYNSPIGITITRMSDNLFIDANDTFLTLSGYDRAEIIGHNALGINLSVDPIPAELIMKELQETGGYKNKEFRLRTKNGQVKVVLINAQTISIGGERHILGLLNDITELKLEEQTQRENEQRLSIIFDKAPFACALSKLVDGRLVDVNEKFERLFGYTKHEVLGKTSQEIGINPNPEMRSKTLAQIQALGSAHEIEMELITNPGVPRVFLVDLDIVSIGEEKYILQTAQDITDRKHTEEKILLLNEDLEQRVVERTAELNMANEKQKEQLEKIQILTKDLQEQAIRDPLTGLFNRRYLEVTLERELIRSARNKLPLGIIMVDIDHFKGFNDRYGHAAGDALLRQFGRYTLSHLRGYDIACRYGGEEFLLILPGASPQVTLDRAEIICRGIHDLQIDFEGRSLGDITASLGVAVSPKNGLTSAEILHSVDAAMYRAKQAGRDRVAVSD